MGKIIRGVVLNDVHFGIKESKRLYDELHQVSDFLENNEIDVMFFAGDYFDCKLSLSDPASFYAIQFMSRVLDIAKRKNIVIRMIQGTRSHDLNQLQIFEQHQVEEGLNFKIIENVQTEELFGEKFLYIPEEYPEDSEEYYKDFKNENAKYAAIIGHGTWDFVAFESQIEHGKQNATLSAPVFIYEEWKHTVEKGFISFGHIHGRGVYKKKIFYSGSFSRWGYGEISERGFTYFEYDTENKEYKVEFKNNTEAPEYRTLAVKDIVDVKSDVDPTMLQTLLEAETCKSDYLRIDLSGLSKENIEIFRKYFANNPNVKIEVRERKSMIKESKEETTDFEKYHYITRRQVPINEMVKRFCKEELEKDLSLEQINSILTEKKKGKE